VGCRKLAVLQPDDRASAVRYTTNTLAFTTSYLKRAAFANTRLVVLSPDNFDLIDLYEQYSAAAYCPANFDAAIPSTQVTCRTASCPRVEGAEIQLKFP
jgi:hypothetical protein